MHDSELHAIQQEHYSYRRLRQFFLIHGSFFILIILSQKWTSSIVDILPNIIINYHIKTHVDVLEIIVV